MAVLEGVTHYSHVYSNYIKDGSLPEIAVCDCLHRTGNGGDESHRGQHQRGNEVLYMLTLCCKYLTSYHIPDRSQLSMRFRSASTQKSFPSLLSTTSATGRIKPVVKSTSLSVPSRAARSILGALSCMLVKYMYLRTQTAPLNWELQGQGMPLCAVSCNLCCKREWFHRHGCGDCSQVQRSRTKHMLTDTLNLKLIGFISRPQSASAVLHSTLLLQSWGL